MCCTAVLLVPWVNRMEAMGVKARILADDMFIIAEGPDHIQKFLDAVNETHQMLQDMGAKVAPNKSMNFSSVPSTAKWLAAHKWKHLPENNRTIRIANSIETWVRRSQ